MAIKNLTPNLININEEMGNFTVRISFEMTKGLFNGLVFWKMLTSSLRIVMPALCVLTLASAAHAGTAVALGFAGEGEERTAEVTWWQSSTPATGNDYLTAVQAADHERQVLRDWGYKNQDIELLHYSDDSEYVAIGLGRHTGTETWTQEILVGTGATQEEADRELEQMFKADDMVIVKIYGRFFSYGSTAGHGGVAGN